MSTTLVRYDAMCTAVEALEDTNHCPSFKIPSESGVYVFDNIADGSVLYVGESQNLRRRLMHHERGYLRRTPAVRLRIIPCLNHKQVEDWLVKSLNPKLNGMSEGMHIKRSRAGRSLDDVWNILFGAAS